MLAGVISDVIEAARPAGAPRREWSEHAAPRVVANRLPRPTKAGSVDVLLPADVQVGQKLRVAAHGHTFVFTVPAGALGGQKLLVGLPAGIAEAAALERARERMWTMDGTRRFAAAGVAAAAAARTAAAAAAAAAADEAGSSESAEERRVAAAAAAKAAAAKAADEHAVGLCVEGLVEEVERSAEAARREQARREERARQQLEHQRRAPAPAPAPAPEPEPKPEPEPEP